MSEALTHKLCLLIHFIKCAVYQSGLLHLQSKHLISHYYLVEAETAHQRHRIPTVCTFGQIETKCFKYEPNFNKRKVNGLGGENNVVQILTMNLPVLLEHPNRRGG